MNSLASPSPDPLTPERVEGYLARAGCSFDAFGRAVATRLLREVQERHRQALASGETVTIDLKATVGLVEIERSPATRCVKVCIDGDCVWIC